MVLSLVDDFINLEIVLFPLTICSTLCYHAPGVIRLKKGKTEHHTWQFLPLFSVILVVRPIGHRLFSAMHAANLSRLSGERIHT